MILDMSDKGDTLPLLLDLWLKANRGLIADETISLYRGLVEAHAVPFFAEGAEISEARVKEFIAGKRAEGLSDTTINTIVRVLRRTLEYGATIGACTAPEWNLERRTPRRKRETVVIGPEEERRLTEYLTDHPGGKELCLFLMLTSGLTVGEVLDLQWKDVSFKKGGISVRTTRGSGKRRVRTIPIDERQRLFLQKMAGAPEAYLSTGTEKKLSPAKLESRWRLISRDLQLPPMSPTSLRHTFAVRAIGSGWDYDTLSRQLGVENGPSFRSFYGDLVPAEQKERLDRERLESRKVRQAPSSVNSHPVDEESSEYRRKIALRREELKAELESLEGDLAIVRALRNADGLQGQARRGLYELIEKLLGDDKDGRYLVEYLRCNMRVADMPLRRETSAQAIRRHVSSGFRKLAARIEELSGYS